MPVVAKTLKPCPEPKSTISGRTLTEQRVCFLRDNIKRFASFFYQRHFYALLTRQGAKGRKGNKAGVHLEKITQALACVAAAITVGAKQNRRSGQAFGNRTRQGFKIIRGRDENAFFIDQLLLEMGQFRLPVRMQKIPQGGPGLVPRPRRVSAPRWPTPDRAPSAPPL